MIGFLSVLRPAVGESPGALSWWLITAGSDVTKVNRWNSGAKHKRDNIGQAAGYPGSRGSRDPGLGLGRAVETSAEEGVLAGRMRVRGAPPALPARPGARRRDRFEPTSTGRGITDSRR